MKVEMILSGDAREKIAGILSMASSDTTRPELCGMLVETIKGENKIRIVATDGHGLATTKIGVEQWFKDGAEHTGAPDTHAFFIPWTAFYDSKTGGVRVLLSFFKLQYDQATHLSYVQLGIIGDAKNSTLQHFQLEVKNKDLAIRTHQWEPETQTLQFPDWRRVLPDLTQGTLDPDHAVGLNTVLISRYFAARYGRAAGACSAVAFTESMGGIVFTDVGYGESHCTSGDPDFLGLVMPLRLKKGHKEQRQLMKGMISSIKCEQRT